MTVERFVLAQAGKVCMNKVVWLHKGYVADGVSDTRLI